MRHAAAVEQGLGGRVDAQVLVGRRRSWGQRPGLGGRGRVLERDELLEVQVLDRRDQRAAVGGDVAGVGEHAGALVRGRPPPRGRRRRRRPAARPPLVRVQRRLAALVPYFLLQRREGARRRRHLG